jgi:protoheme IX farnesyltransferase
MALARVRALLELGKPRLSALAVFAVVAGLFVGARGRPLPAALWIGTTVGTLAIAFSSAAFNMLVERRLDVRMQRTAGRPLPSGRLQPWHASGFGVVTAVLGTVVLLLTSNLLATALCLAILLLYVLVYTPLKRITSLNTLAGAVPGALPPVVGYAASSGRVDEQAMVLFLILFFWQIPHFLSIAWRYREDYRAGGMKMLPVVEPDGRSTSRQMLVYTAALVIATLYAYEAGLSGPLYAVAAACLGVAFAASATIAALWRRDSAMRLCFLVSIAYLPLLLGFMILDRPE